MRIDSAQALAWRMGRQLLAPIGSGAVDDVVAHNPRWTGLPELDDAGRRAVRFYLSTYGSATPAHFQYWLGEGLGAGRKRIEAWLADLGDDVTAVDVGGAAALVLTEHADLLVATDTTGAVRSLAGRSARQDNGTSRS